MQVHLQAYIQDMYDISYIYDMSYHIYDICEIALILLPAPHPLVSLTWNGAGRRLEEGGRERKHTSGAVWALWRKRTQNKVYKIRRLGRRRVVLQPEGQEKKQIRKSKS